MTDNTESDLPVDHLTQWRKWRLTGLGEDLRTGLRCMKPSDTLVRVMNYNLLAPVYASQHHYLYDPAHLDWSWRWSQLQREIRQHQPDLLCLQEVQFSPGDNLLETQIQPALDKAGYHGLAKCRTGNKEDGCAIFYNSDKFSLEFSHEVEYNVGEAGILDKDNIAVIAGLKSAVSGSQFLIATTHLLFSPRRHEVRLAQTALLLAEVDRLAWRDRRGRGGGGGGHLLPVIITGDFNSQPNSPSYRLLKYGQVGYNNPGTPSFLPPSVKVGDNCQFVEDITETTETVGTEGRSERRCLTQRLGLRSVQSGPGEVTTFQSDWVTVDYIFYSTQPGRPGGRSKDGRREGKLKLVGRLSLPSAQQMMAVGSLPNYFSPSDHLPLLADFLLVK